MPFSAREAVEVETPARRATSSRRTERMEGKSIAQSIADARDETSHTAGVAVKQAFY
jgi:hypothetical protein